ncbi:porin [Collimonas arenae]|nr:porin [Collimonas arenae]
MKKAILAFGLLGAHAITVCAQADVVTYGVVDIGVAHEKNSSLNGSVTRMDSGIFNGNRLGIKGAEDFGAGVSAVFTLESGFTADTGVLGQGGLLFGRQAWVGLSGDLGVIQLGRQRNTVYANAYVFDPFADALAGDSARLFNYSGYRSNNMVSYGYESNGLRGQLQYSLGEVVGNAAASSTRAGYAGYRKGPLDVVLTHHRTNNTAGNTGKATLIGGNYDFGMIKAFAAYAWNKGVRQDGSISHGADIRSGLIGITASIGDASTVMVSYIRLWDKVVSDANASQVAIGYVHDLSKRTALYASHSRLTNESNASYLVATEGLTAHLFNAGIRHKF